MKKFNEWIEYRKNKKIVKRQIMATSLPTIRKVVTNSSDISKTILSIVDACKDTTKDELIATTIAVLAEKFEEDEIRVYDTVKYITTLSPDDIRKIVIDATVETMDK